MTIQKATFLSIKKGGEIYFILVMEDKKVFINFGDDNWFDVKKIHNIKELKGKKKYEKYLSSKSFRKNIKETVETIDSSKDHLEIVEKFIKDFKKDRGNKIIKNEVEIDTSKNLDDIKYNG